MLVRNYKSNGIWFLVIEEHALINILRLFTYCFLNTFGAEFLTVIGYKQTFETAEHIEESVFRQIAHIACVKPSVPYCIGSCLLVFPVPVHNVTSTDKDLT